MTSSRRISVRLLAATFAFCITGAQAQVQPGVAQEAERRASPLKKPVASSAAQPPAASPNKTGLEDKKNVISSGSTGGGEARALPGSGGANAQQQQREAATERSKGAPAGSLMGDAQQRDATARGKPVDATEVVKTRQTRDVEGLTKAADPKSGLGKQQHNGGSAITDKSGANPLDGAPKSTVSSSDGKNQSSKRAEQSDGPVTKAAGFDLSKPTGAESASAKNDAAGDRQALKEHIGDIPSLGTRLVDAAKSEGGLTPGRALAEIQRSASSTQSEKERDRIPSAPVGNRGTPTPDQAGGDGGPVPGAVGGVDRAQNVSETQAALKRQVTLPGDGGTGSTERFTVNPGEASKAVMGARQQNLINPSRGDATVTAGPVTGGTAGGKPVTNPGGGDVPSGSGGGGDGSGQPCPTCNTK